MLLSLALLKETLEASNYFYKQAIIRDYYF